MPRKGGIDLHKGARPDRIPLVQTHTMLKQLPNGTMLYLPDSVDEHTARQRMEAYASNVDSDGSNLFKEMFGDDPWEQLDKIKIS